VDGIEHPRTLLFAWPDTIKCARDRVGVTGAFLQPANVLIECDHCGTAALSSHQGLDHGSDLLDFREHRTGNA
jgi:hypothetical protein